MTSKQLVLSIYPDAYALKSRFRDLYGLGWGIFTKNDPRELLSSNLIELTERVAWKNAAKNIKDEVLRKLEE